MKILSYLRLSQPILGTLNKESPVQRQKGPRDYEVEIETKDGSLANKVLVEKSSGRILSAYSN